MALREKLVEIDTHLMALLHRDCKRDIFSGEPRQNLQPGGIHHE